MAVGGSDIERRKYPLCDLSRKYHFGGLTMALIFNNLLINKMSTKYKPFLFNLISGRRRLLDDNEFRMICSMLKKSKTSFYTESEVELFHRLIAEKQFITDESRNIIEEKLISSGHFDIKSKFAADFSFGIELTRACNMSCSYCYAKARINDRNHMTRNHIDHIYDFFRTYADEQNKIRDTKSIWLTGGEPLTDINTIDLINYVVLLWPSTKLFLYTNGVNLHKYYHKLPLASIEGIHISLDGVKDVHMSRRYSNKNIDGSIYDDIISGIKRLLNDGVIVTLKTVYDRSSYVECQNFMEFLASEGISDSPNYRHKFGVVNDATDPLNLDVRFNDKQDMFMFQKYFSESNVVHPPNFMSATTLFKALGRPKNEPFIPKHQRCSSELLSVCYFSCDGNVYFCECVHEGKGVLGTFYPKISLYDNIASGLLNRSVMKNATCRKCVYKFVCLGGCPATAAVKNTEMDCGIFADEEVLDNLEFNYC